MQEKKKHIAILVDSYYPHMTMNGVVGRRIYEIIEKNCDVSIISYKCYEKEKHEIPPNVYPIYFWSVYWENMLGAKISESKNYLANKFWCALLYIKKVLSYITRNMSILGINKHTVRKLEKMLNKVHKEKSIDKVLSISAPFEFQMANYRFAKKNKNVECITYQIDYWVKQMDKGYPMWLQNRRKNARVDMLKDIAKTCKMYMLPFIKEAEGKLIDYEHITACQLPLLIDNKTLECKHVVKEDNSVNLVFAGSLNREDRDPEKLIQMLEKIYLGKPVKMHFYHRGNCAAYIHNMSVAKPELIIDHGQVSSLEAYKAMAEADILVSIGIVKGDQIAGKTFDYISTGKRIMYIHWTKEDVNAKFLEKYPLVLCLNMADDSIDECAIKLEKFLEITDGKSLKFSEVAELFPEALPEKVCQKLFCD